MPDLNGFLWILTCSPGALSGLDCPLLDDNNMCPNPSATTFDQQGLIRDVTFSVKGTTGQQYTINFEARGVLGTRCYTGGTAAVPAGSSTPESSNNGWYVGGEQALNSIWNTYELHVSPAVAGEANVYFFNYFPGMASGGFCEKHETFPMNYTASFKVLGGGTMDFRIHDANCKGQMNCGAPDNQATCASPRTIDLTGMVTQPQGFAQPYTQSNGDTPQWLYLDVTSITSP